MEHQLDLARITRPGDPAERGGRGDVGRGRVQTCTVYNFFNKFTVTRSCGRVTISRRSKAGATYERTVRSERGRIGYPRPGSHLLARLPEIAHPPVRGVP